jgi:hypothetical protein
MMLGDGEGMKWALHSSMAVDWLRHLVDTNLFGAPTTHFACPMFEENERARNHWLKSYTIINNIRLTEHILVSL